MFPDPSFVAIAGGPVEFFPVQFVGEILLLHIMIGIIVGIFISGSPSKFCRSFVMGVLDRKSVV